MEMPKRGDGQAGSALPGSHQVLDGGATRGTEFVSSGTMSLSVCTGCTGRKSILGIKTGSLFGWVIGPLMLYSKVLLTGHKTRLMTGPTTQALRRISASMRA